MLIIAGVLFILAILLFFIDKWFDSANMDLKWAIRLLIFSAALLIIYHTYKTDKKPEHEDIPPTDGAVVLE